MTVWTAPSEIALLTSAIQQLGRAIDANYCWITLHDRQHGTARIVCEYINTEHQIYPTSKIDREIDVLRYPQFYDRLLEIESWIDPPVEIIPTAYRNLLMPTAKLLICPITVIDPWATIARSGEPTDWLVGEIGIVMAGNSAQASFPPQAIVQTFSHAIQLFRSIHPQG